MGFRKVIVLGAGAIGSVYGALLSENEDVTLVGSEKHVDAVNSNGLQVFGEVNETFKPRADIVIREIPERTLILLTTKAYDSAKAIKRIEELLMEDTTILVLQNGLGNEEIVKHVVGKKAKVLRGITTAAAEFFKPGEIRFWHGDTIIERDAAAKQISEIFNASGLKTILTTNINQEVWNKLVANNVINPLTAIFRVTNREICIGSLESIRHQIVSECVAVGNIEGMRFPARLAQEIDREIMNYSNFSSMCQDVIKGKRTEIDFLNGKIVELGRKRHIPTPVNETLVCMIKFLEEKNGLPRKD